MDSRKKSHYANKVKCSTLKSAQPPKMGSEDHGKFMLGLASDDPLCEYRQKLVTVQKKKSCEMVKAEGPAKTEPHVESLRLNEVSGPTKTPEVTVAPEILKQNDNPITFADPIPVQTEENSKAFMGSLGSWINDLFSTPSTKRPHTAPKIETKPFQPQVRIEEDPDYFKSINDLKEQFLKKLKIETSVHILNDDKLLKFDFSKKGKKRSKSVPQTSHRDEELISVSKESTQKPNNAGKHLKSNSILNDLEAEGETGTSVQLYRAKNALDLNNSNFVKENKKQKRKDRNGLGLPDEYVFPVSADLSRKLLLSVDDPEKYSRLYKNTQVGVQESQHYIQRTKSKSYLNSTRCYTTNASMRERSENVKLSSYVSSSHGKNLVAVGKQRALVEFARDNSTYVKARTQRWANNIRMDARLDAKGSSDDLVKYLMKKVKVNHNPQSKKKNAAQPLALIAGKSKFMQSATSSLVMNVLSKKEQENFLPTKTSSRMLSEKSELVPSKPSHNSQKAWNKYDDSAVRFDVKRVSNQNRFNKSTYLSDSTNDVDDAFFHDKSYRYGKRYYDSSLKDSKESEKHGRKSEIKALVTKLDKTALYKMAKVKPKDPKRKNMFENFDSFDEKENVLGKFQHQHELFKNSKKSVQPSNLDSEHEDHSKSCSSENIIEGHPTSSSNELTVVDSHFQLMSNEQSSEFVKSLIPSHNKVRDNTDQKIFSCFNIDDNSLNLSIDRNKTSDKLPAVPTKDKVIKTKSLHYVKDAETALLGLPIDEKPEKISSPNSLSVFEPSAIATNQHNRAIKSLDTTLLNRRIPANNLGEMTKQKNKPLAINYKSYSSFPDSCKGSKDSDKKGKDKKKDNLKKSTIEEESECGFEKTKKPGPNCEEGFK